MKNIKCMKMCCHADQFGRIVIVVVFFILSVISFTSLLTCNIRGDLDDTAFLLFVILLLNLMFTGITLHAFITTCKHKNDVMFIEKKYKSVGVYIGFGIFVMIMKIIIIMPGWEHPPSPDEKNICFTFSKTFEITQMIITAVIFGMYIIFTILNKCGKPEIKIRTNSEGKDVYSYV